MAMREIHSKGGNFTKSEEYSFEKVGDNVTGTLVEKVTLTSKKNHKPFQKYVIQVGERNVGFLGSHDLDGKLSQVETGTHVSVTLTKFSPNPHGGKDMKIYKVDADDSSVSTTSAAEVVARARIA